MPDNTSHERDIHGCFKRAGEDPQADEDPHIAVPLKRRQKRTAAPTPPIRSNSRWITRQQLAERWNCSVRTLERDKRLKLVRLTPGCGRIDMHVVKRIEAEQ